MLIREATGMTEGKYFGNFFPLFLNILEETGYAGSLVLEYFDPSSRLEAKVKLLRLLKRFQRHNFVVDMSLLFACFDHVEKWSHIFS